MTFSSAWGVFLLFAIPFGPGIPGGVLLAQKHGIAWPWMEVLYFISDVCLACVFEPMMLWMIAASRRSAGMSRFVTIMKESVRRSIANYGSATGHLTLIAIAFGVDPMTGRAAAKAAGHGFLSGWTLAIAGDMIYFSVLMVSTLWLNGILGDGTKTMVVIMLAMFVAPPLWRRLRERRAAALR